MLPGILLRKPHRDQAQPPPQQVHVEKWPDIKSYTDSSWPRSEKAEPETPLRRRRKLSPVACKRSNPWLAGDSQQRTEVSNAAFPSFPFCWWEEEIPPAHSGTGRKRKEVAQGKSLTQNHKPAISTPGGRHGGGETVLPGSKGHPSCHRPRPTLSVRE